MVWALLREERAQEERRRSDRPPGLPGLEGSPGRKEMEGTKEISSKQNDSAGIRTRVERRMLNGKRS
jgi:hypothetical protein